MGVDACGDGDERGFQRDVLVLAGVQRQQRHTGIGAVDRLDLCAYDARALFDGLAQQESVEAGGPPRPPAGQRSAEDRVHPHVGRNAQAEVLPLALDPNVVEAALDDLFRHGQVVALEDLVQPGRDAARAEAASAALEAVGREVGQSALLNDHNVEPAVHAAGFPQQMNGEEGTGRSSTHDRDRVAILEAARWTAR